MKKLGAWLLAFLLASSGPLSVSHYSTAADPAKPTGKPLGIEGKDRGKDGYTFEGKQIVLLNFPVELHEYKTQFELNQAYKRISRKDIPVRWTVRGFSTLRQEDGVCEVHIMDPDAIYEPEILGHEIFHCAHGNFHRNQGI